MSMWYAGENGYGMYLTNDEIDVFMQKYFQVNSEELMGQNIFDMNENYEDYIEDIRLKIGASMLREDDYDGRNISFLLPDEPHPEEAVDNDFVEGMFVYSSKQGTIFANKTDRLYSSPEEMADEFETNLGKYLPSDFNYLGHLAFFNGANYA